MEIDWIRDQTEACDGALEDSSPGKNAEAWDGNPFSVHPAGQFTTHGDNGND